MFHFLAVESSTPWVIVSCTSIMVSQSESTIRESTDPVKRGLPQMLKGRAIINVMKEPARLAEAAGASSVMALGRKGRRVRMSDSRISSLLS